MSGQHGSGAGSKCVVAALLLCLASRPVAAAPFAYVTNSYSRTVWVIDTAGGDVVAVIPVDGSPWGVAAHPDGKRVYVTLPRENRIVLLDAAGNRVSAEVPLPVSPPFGFDVAAQEGRVAALPTPTRTATVGDNGGPTPTATTSGPTPTSTPKRVGVEPIGVAVDAVRRRVYVTTVGGVSVLDEQGGPLASVPVVLAANAVSRPQGVIASADGSRIYVAVDNGYVDAGALQILSGDDLSPLATVPVGVHPLGVAAVGGRVYVANNVSNTVSVIDAAAMNAVTEIAVEPGPVGVATDGSGSRVYVSSTGAYQSGTGSVAVIDVGLDQVADTVEVPPGAYGIDVSADGARVAVASGGVNVLSFIDAAAGAVVATAPAGRDVFAFGRFLGPPADPGSTPTGTPTPAPRREVAYVCNSAARSLSVVDLVTRRLERFVPLDNVPRELAVTPDGERLYVYLDDAFDHTSLVEFAPETLEPVGSVDGVPHVFSLAMSPDGERLYAGGDGRISIVDTATNDVTASRALPFTYNQSIALAPDGATLYASGAPIAFLDARTLAPLPGPPAPSAFGRVVVAPDGARLYVGGGAVAVVDVQSRALLDTLGWSFTPGSAGADEFGVSPDGLTFVALLYRRFYSGLRWSSLDFVDTDTDESRGETPAEVDPARVAFSRESGLAYVTNRGANTISVVDVGRGAIVDTIAVGNGPDAIAIGPAPGAVLSPTITVRRTRTPTSTPTVTPNLCPPDLDIEPAEAHRGRPFVVRGECNRLFGDGDVVLGGVMLGRVHGGAQGYVGRFAVPATIALGPQPLLVYDGSGGVAGIGTFTVTATCCSDCNADDRIDAGEIARGTGVALGRAILGVCRSADADGNGRVTVDELVRAVRAARHGCDVCSAK